MQLYELRIGNFFELSSLYDTKKKMRTISEIGERRVQADGKSITSDELIPIRITSDILLRCGFTQFNWIKDASVFECAYFKCTLDSNGVNLFCDNLKNLKPVMYLHQLQNLYFDLTGEELKMNFNEIKLRKTVVA